MISILPKTGRRILYFTLLAAFVLLLAPPVRRFFFSGGLRWLYILLFAFTLAYELTPLMIRLARRFSILDLPDDRKSIVKGPLFWGGSPS